MNNKTVIDLSKKLLAEINSPQLQPSKVKQFIADGADINYRSEEDGYTALMLAVDNDDEATATYLLQQGADPLIKNKHQETASDIALPHSPIYHIIKNYELLNAALHNDIDTAKAALANGADVNFQGKGGYTALLIAAEQNQLEFVELLLINKADLSIENDEGWEAEDLATDQYVYRTLFAKKPLDEDTKQYMREMSDQTKWAKGRLKCLADRKGQPFALSQLKMVPLRKDFKPAPSTTQLAELEQYWGHPLPQYLKELFINYNGCRPKLKYYRDHAEGSIRHFYFLDDDKESVSNIWWAIENYSEFLSPDTLPFAEDSYGGVFFLKWVDGNAQVWRFQYSEQPFEYDDEEDDDIPTAYTFLEKSLDELLEALYAIED